MNEKLHRCKQRDFISKLKKLGFTGPHPGAKHFFMKYGRYKQTIPNYDEYSIPLLKKLIKQIENGIGRDIRSEEWNKL